ncbi:MAG: hypothetical protein LBB78_03860 [Spirochaetaceae bacterium]|jgi:hypothetical protein|nr:hypothetical protein [Spirochaetaceae bacterium]
MHKKSLFFGTATLALLVLFALAGCSNPASGDTAAAPPIKGGVSYPPATVFMNDFTGLQRLLNNPDTNAVTYIAYSGTIDNTVTISKGKTVYLNGGPITLSGNHHIIVEPEAKLVLESDVTTADDGRLLVKGMVEVYGTLTTTSNGSNDPALQVADYFDTSGSIVNGRATVLGTSQVLVMPNGTLVLTADDMANQPTGDRFTPAQAWAAAGKGNLLITGTLTPSYTVQYLLDGVLPQNGRTYTVTLTQGGGVLPSIIPAGTNITASGVIEDADNHNLTVNGNLTATSPSSTFKDIETLTVNGRLIANAATFESVKTLTVSSSNSGNLISRVSAAPSASWNGGYLGADSATLASVKTVIIGDYGEFASESPAFAFPAGSKIGLGRNAIFTAAATTNNSFDDLEGLSIGPASRVSIASPALTFKSLKTLSLQDSASLDAAAGNAVTFLVEATPSTPPKKTEVNLGLNSFYNVGIAPTAKVDMAIVRDASLISGSTIAINEGSTLTVETGKTFTVESGATVDLRNLGINVPANADAAPVQIKGTVELTGTGTLIGQNPGLFPTSPTDIYKFVSFAGGGKIVLNYGTMYVLGAVTTPALPSISFIGSSATAAYRWNGAEDGAQIIFDKIGITIRDADGGGAVVTSNVGPANTYAHIPEGQTLTLDMDVQLKSNNGKGIYFAGATAGGAQLKGPGKIVVGTTRITGGSSGWRVFGSETIGIVQNNPATAFIANTGIGTTTSFKATGPSAVIRQAAARGNSVIIQANTIVDLSGTAASPGGSIVLESGPNPGKLAFGGANTAKLLLGDGIGGMAAIGRLSAITIGGETVINNGLSVGDFVVLGGKLITLGGKNTWYGNGITAGTVPNNDVTVVSTAGFTNQ